MSSSAKLRGLRDTCLYQDDVLLLTTERPETPALKEVGMVSVIAMKIRFTTSSPLIRKVIENNHGVSVWRVHRIEKTVKKNHEIPEEEIFTYHFLVIKESFRAYGTASEVFFEKTCEKLKTKRTRVISSISNGFDCTILEKEKLKEVYLNKKLVKEGRVKVPFDIEFIRAITELDRVPKRVVPPLPYSSLPVKIPLGRLFINSQKIVGLNKLSKVTVFGGSDRSLLIGSLQFFIKSLAGSDRKILVLDIGNELGGLSEGLLQTENVVFPVTIWKLGENFFLNLCSVEIPADLNEPDSQLTYLTNVLSYILAFGSENYRFLGDIPQLRLKLANALKKLPAEDYSLYNIAQSEEFSELLDIDQVTSERLVAELKLFTSFPELNFTRFNQDYNAKIGMTKGITVIRFPYQSVVIKRVISAFLLQKVALRCDHKTIVIITDAEQLFSTVLNNNDSIRVFEEAVGQYYKKILQSGQLVLSTYSIRNLSFLIQKDINTGIFFKFINVEDREWISSRYALEQKLDDVNAFLQSIDGEGLLFREDSPHTCDHFIPFLLNPVNDLHSTEETVISTPSVVNISDDLFVLLMTVLGLIRKASLKENEVLRNLYAAGFMKNYIELNWRMLQHSPYLILSDINGNQTVTITQKGKEFHNNLEHIIYQLPPVLEYGLKDFINVLTNLKERGDTLTDDDSETCQQLVDDIHEFAGSLLNGHFQVQGKIDWKLFKNYLGLLDIQGYEEENQSHRFDLLETIFTKTIEQ